MTSAALASEPTAGDARGRGRLWWGGAIAGAAAALMFCYLRIAGTVPVLSDGAANAVQARDMLHGNLLLHGWWVTDVSFLTIELPQYALVIAAAGLHPEVVHICAAMTYTLLVLLVAYVARGRSSGTEAVVQALVAAGIMLAPEPGAASWIVLSSPDHIGTGVPLLLLLSLLDRARASRWLPAATFVLLAWASVADPLVEVIGALPLAAVCLARVLVCRPRRLAVRTFWYELSLAASAVLAVLAAQGVVRLIPALGGYQINKGPTSIIPLGDLPANAPLVLRSLLALFGADFQDAPTGGGQRAVNLAFAAVHLAGLALVLAAVLAAGWGLVRSLARLAHASSAGRSVVAVAGQADGGRALAGAAGQAGTPAAGDLVSDVTVVAIVGCVAAYFLVFRLKNVYAAHDLGPVLSLGAALAGRQLGGPLARACGLRGPWSGAAPAAVAAHRYPQSGGRLARVVVLPALVALLACYGAMLGCAAAQRQTPPANAALAVWLQRHGLRSGLAGYWEAASVTLDSGGAITMGSVIAGPGGRLAPRHWEQDMRIYDPATHRASFVVLAPDSPMTGQDVVRTFGRPAGVYRFQTATIMVWRGNLLPELGRAIN